MRKNATALLLLTIFGISTIAFATVAMASSTNSDLQVPSAADSQGAISSIG